MEGRGEWVLVWSATRWEGWDAVECGGRLWGVREGKVGAGSGRGREWTWMVTVSSAEEVVPFLLRAAPIAPRWSYPS